MDNADTTVEIFHALGGGARYTKQRIGAILGQKIQTRTLIKMVDCGLLVEENGEYSSNQLDMFPFVGELKMYSDWFDSYLVLELACGIGEKFAGKSKIYVFEKDRNGWCEAGLLF